MIFKDTKELCFFMKECSKLGISECQVGDIKLYFSPPKDTWAIPRSQRQAIAKAAPAIEREGEDTLKESLKELYLSQLAVDDPEAFERESIKGING